MSVIETLRTTAKKIGFDDCAPATRPTIVTLKAELASENDDDCACPEPATIQPIGGALDLKQHEGIIAASTQVAGQDLTVAVPTRIKGIK